MRVNRLCALVLAGAVYLVSSSLARALPPPMTETEMMQAADLVVDATCISVVCEGPPVADAEKITTTYVSTLFPTFSYKGGLPNSIQIRGYEYQYFGPPPIGGWHQGAVPEGWAGKLYLEHLPDGTYTKVWWNAMEEDSISSNPQPLPNCEVADPDAGVETDASLDGGTVTDAETPDGAGADSGTGDPSSASGCNCDESMTGSARGGLLAVLLIGLLFAVRCRRRKRAARSTRQCW